MNNFGFSTHFGPAQPQNFTPSGVYWFNWHSGVPVPQCAVRGGTDSDGSPIYVGKSSHSGDTIPAKVIPRRNEAYISYNGEEIRVYNAQVLCRPELQWISTCNGRFPNGAIPAGQTRSGETLYIARVHHNGIHTIGKVHPSHGCCYIPYGGRELSFKSYEVLVLPNN